MYKMINYLFFNPELNEITHHILECIDASVHFFKKQNVESLDFFMPLLTENPLYSYFSRNDEENDITPLYDGVFFISISFLRIFI